MDGGKKNKGIERKRVKLDDSTRAFQWNKLFMSTLGLWPAKPSDFLFSVTFGYFCYEMVLEYIDLLLFIDDLEHVILNLTENVAFTELLVRMITMRLYIREFGQLISKATRDIEENKYNDEERKVLIAYHKKSKLYMKLLVINTGITATSYYAKPLLEQFGEIVEYFGSQKNENTTFIFLLPYRFHTFYELNDASTYFWTYLSQLPFLYISWMSQSASDCLMVALVYHVSGQIAVLATRITNIDTDPSKCTKQLHDVVRSQARLLRMGRIIEKAFSAMLLSQLMGGTILICILGYQILACLANGERAILISLVSYIILVLLILYAYCSIAETLITESTRLCEAYYNCKWYDMVGKNAKIIIFCMARSQKPLQLTAGKFSVFCLTTFTNTVKASMGYLSVLRTVM
ncbi:odorant receptor 2a-like [Copidosoma floridanum]|uniref:odorant receptor 2a-like n=1 Tax=Copidosoma floridanum TaxID=29053 RepID=UPI0006C948E9|nr:odorant receptor 2a-like [Copidosoma floridanum]